MLSEKAQLLFTNFKLTELLPFHRIQLLIKKCFPILCQQDVPYWKKFSREEIFAEFNFADQSSKMTNFAEFNFADEPFWRVSRNLISRMSNFGVFRGI